MGDITILYAKEELVSHEKRLIKTAKISESEIFRENLGFSKNFPKLIFIQVFVPKATHLGIFPRKLINFRTLCS